MADRDQHPSPKDGAAPFDRDALIALIMEETTDDIVADGWDRLGKPNVLVQGCRYIRRNTPPSPEGYENPEASAKQFAGFIADRVLKALATREEAPAEAGELETVAKAQAKIKGHRDVNAMIWLTEPQIEKPAWEFYLDDAGVILSAIRAQPQAREDAQPVCWGVDVAEDAPQEFKDWAARFNASRPAPDALRVAVEALEKIEATPRDRFQVKRMKRYAAEALSALQAEQRAK